jgi:hypothetical protein
MGGAADAVGLVPAVDAEVADVVEIRLEVSPMIKVWVQDMQSAFADIAGQVLSRLVESNVLIWA